MNEAVTKPSADPAPLPAADALAPISGESFRAALAGVPAAVHVVASDGPAGRSGFTGTAFAAISDEPPTVLVSLNRGSRQNAIFKANGVFSVNLLPAAATALADVFAGRTGESLAERFVHGRWTRLATGAPVLEDALVSLDCRLVGQSEVATHSVLFGEVVATRRAPLSAADALFYGDRSYFSL